MSQRLDCWSPERFVSHFVTAEPALKAEILARARTAGLSDREASSLLQRAEVRGIAHRCLFGPTRLVGFSSRPSP